jgi:hypothetical protein
MLRPLVHYFLIGGLLFSGKAIYGRSHADGPEITVRVPESADPAAVDRAIRDAILLNEARRHGWDRRDPIVYGHLVRNMRFIEPQSDEHDAILYRRALEMGMHEHDPIVRVRLLYRAREALEFVPDSRVPTRDELEAHLSQHSDRFEREGRVRFQQVFLSGSKRGDKLATDATTLRQSLEEIGEANPSGLGDPLPGLRTEQSATVSKIRAEYGDALANAVEEALVGVWRGPIPSVYGLHFIKVIESEPSYVPPLDVIGLEVQADLLRELRAQLREERMQELLEAYTVNVERVP